MQSTSNCYDFGSPGPSNASIKRRSLIMSQSDGTRSKNMFVFVSDVPFGERNKQQVQRLQVKKQWWWWRSAQRPWTDLLRWKKVTTNGPKTSPKQKWCRDKSGFFFLTVSLSRVLRIWSLDVSGMQWCLCQWDFPVVWV